MNHSGKGSVLFQTKDKCCGCGACLNICPVQATSMQEDEYGFIYPQIDQKRCRSCGKCSQVCCFQNAKVTNCVKNVYAAAARDESLLVDSASGGVFAVLANSCKQNGGIVFGAAFNKNGECTIFRLVT